MIQIIPLVNIYCSVTILVTVDVVWISKWIYWTHTARNYK
jgi:hypothetical protein